MPIVILPGWQRTSPTLETLLLQLVDAGIPQPVLEHRFAPPRRWRFDLAWPDRMLALELQGGTFVSGRHTRGVGYREDCEKLNQAVLDGWRVLQITPAMIVDGSALTVIELAWA
jgi:hypothetical protein